jgi:hypothetical protein
MPDAFPRDIVRRQQLFVPWFAAKRPVPGERNRFRRHPDLGTRRVADIRTMISSSKSCRSALVETCANYSEIARLQRAFLDPNSSADSFSMIGVNSAAAFNRDWQREGILNARFEKLLDLNTAALILKSLGVAR